MSPDSHQLITHYHSQSGIRDPKLFSHFLIPGYNMTTLTSVGPEFDSQVQSAKLNLGMFITLIDDLADNPKYFNPKLLHHLYDLLPGKSPTTTPHLGKEDRKIYELARELMTNITANLVGLPHYHTLKDILVFDFETIYRANRYSELMTQHPDIINLKESQDYGHYNMGILAAGMIDLIGSTNLLKAELGIMRECFLAAQRMGRIGNLLATFKREMQENDLTNEVMISKVSHESYESKLLLEFASLKETILDKPVFTFEAHAYAQGAEDLYALHRKLMGVI